MSDILGEAWPKITIVDVGAMDLPGVPVPYKPLLRPGRFELIGFEAVMAECDKLNAQGRPGHRYINRFVGDGTRRNFTLTNHSMTSSLFPPNEPLLRMFNSLWEWTTPVSTTEVQTTRLDDVPELASTRVDLLKIDIQGGEVLVFEGARRVMKDVLVVQTEAEFVRMYQGQPLYGDVARALEDQGFVHHTFLDLSGRTFRPLIINKNANMPLRQNMWSDVVFVRDFTKLQDLTAEQLLKMAVMMHEMYGSVDLAQLCLAHHDKKAGTKFWDSYIIRLVGHMPPGFQRPV